MTRRDMTFHGLVAFGLVVGIVGGNFALHRWMLGDVTSREAAADTAVQESEDDLLEFVPHRATTSQINPRRDAAHRVQLRSLIEKHLPNSSPDEADTWLEQLQDMPLHAAEEILNLRQQNGPLEAIEPVKETASGPSFGGVKLHR